VSAPADTDAHAYRVGRHEPFENIPRRVLQDGTLSFRARGVLCYLLSKPDHWRTSAEKLARETTEGRDAIASALTELEERGYLVRRRVRTDGGRFGWVWAYGDDPATVAAPSPGNPVVVDPPSPGKPDTAEPDTENQGSTTEDREENPDREPRHNSTETHGSQPVGGHLSNIASTSENDQEPDTGYMPASKIRTANTAHRKERAARRGPVWLNSTARKNRAEQILRRWKTDSGQILTESDHLLLARQADDLLRQGFGEPLIRAALYDWGQAGQYRRHLEKHAQTVLLVSDNPLVTGKIGDDRAAMILGSPEEPRQPVTLRVLGAPIPLGWVPPSCTHDFAADPMPPFRDDDTWAAQYGAWLMRVEGNFDPGWRSKDDEVSELYESPRVDTRLIEAWNRAVLYPWREARRAQAIRVLRARADERARV